MTWRQIWKQFSDRSLIGFMRESKTVARELLHYRGVSSSNE